MVVVVLAGGVVTEVSLVVVVVLVSVGWLAHEFKITTITENNGTRIVSFFIPQNFSKRKVDARVDSSPDSTIGIFTTCFTRSR